MLEVLRIEDGVVFDKKEFAGSLDDVLAFFEKRGCRILDRALIEANLNNPRPETLLFVPGSEGICEVVRDYNLFVDNRLIELVEEARPQARIYLSFSRKNGRPQVLYRVRGYYARLFASSAFHSFFVLENSPQPWLKEVVLAGLPRGNNRSVAVPYGSDSSAKDMEAALRKALAATYHEYLIPFVYASCYVNDTMHAIITNRGGRELWYVVVRNGEVVSILDLSEKVWYSLVERSGINHAASLAYLVERDYFTVKLAEVV